MACTEADDLTFREGDGVVVNFTTPGLISGEVGVTRADPPVNLAKDVTVRILAYRRVAGATSANIANDTYIGENTYVADADGKLTACVVDANGKKTTGTPTELRLIQGDYDFYAITPALPVKSDHKTLDVKHGVDYATSLTTQSVAPGSGTVNLTTLDRKCSKIEFNFDRKSANVSQIAIDEVRLIDMSKSPLTGTLAQNLPNASVITDTIKLGGSVFTIDATNAYKATGSTIALPKPAGDFKLGMKLRFNGLSTQVSLSPATITGLALSKGTRYVFKVKLKGGSVTLTLVVADWDGTINVDAEDLGASNSLSIDVGQWEDIDFDAITGGGNVGGTIGNWTEDPNWSTEIGKHPDLSSTTVETPTWGDATVDAPTGGGNGSMGNNDWDDGGTSTPGNGDVNGSTDNWGDSSNSNEDFVNNQPR